MIRILAIAAIAASLPLAALAAPCPGNPDALGTERVLAVDAASTPRVGRKQFPHTLPLAAQGAGAHLRRRTLAGHHAESAGRAQA